MIQDYIERSKQEQKLIKECKDWLFEIYSDETCQEEIQDAEPYRILKEVERLYAGGLGQFIKDGQI